MEHKYGSMETLENAFSRAVAESKGKQVYLTMASTYEQTGDFSGAEVIYTKALKRPQYKKSKKLWIAYHQFKLRSGTITYSELCTGIMILDYPLIQHATTKGDEVGAKEQLARSMQSLSRHKHIEVISKYAMAEFEYGSPDRGRVVFEELLSNYPKRSDLWNLYVDKEIKHGFVSPARQLFERMINAKQNVRTMKRIFKKFLEFEIMHGSDASQEAVKAKAREYVSSIASC